MVTIKHVAVIGAGPAGLCTLRHLLHSNINLNVSIKAVVFEQNNVVGGTWVYEDVDKDTKQEVFSSIYANLKTNLPKQTMMFPDYPFPDHFPTFLHHTHVQEYLNDYADHFHLKKHIWFNTSVMSVSPSLNNERSDAVKWNVLSRSIVTGETVAEIYDAVVVCNGHYSVPSYPDIDGLNNFPGEVFHSHYYRRPSDFQGKDVLILGTGPSGVDIMVELSEYCQTVYVSHRGKRLSSVLAPNVIECPNILHVDENGHFVFEDSSVVVVDTFIQCTGYTLSFPFLSKDSGINIENNIITNLYKHVFSIVNPSLSFVGLTWKTVPLPMFHQQCQYIMKIIAEIKNLPSSEEMMSDTTSEQKERTVSGELERYFHRLGDRQWSYNKEISLLAGNEENPMIVEKLFYYMSQFRIADLWSYKKMEFRAINDSEFEDLSAD